MVGVGAEDLRCDDRPDAHLRQEAGRQLGDDRFDLRFELECFLLQRERSPGARADRDRRGALLWVLRGAETQAGAARELLIGRQRAQPFTQAR